MNSLVVNKEIRKSIRPMLKTCGFTKFTERNAWRVGERVIEVINFQSFNNYLADALSCTTFSFGINLGIYYAPVHNNPWVTYCSPKFPQEYECHARRFLPKTIDQSQFLRSDIWYVDVEGMELPRVMEDAKEVIFREGFQWLEEMSNLRNALEAFQHKPSTNEEMLGGNFNSIARSEVVCGIALEVGDTNLATSYLTDVIANPFYARQPDIIQTLHEKYLLLASSKNERKT